MAHHGIDADELRLIPIDWVVWVTAGDLGDHGPGLIPLRTPARAELSGPLSCCQPATCFARRQKQRRILCHGSLSHVPATVVRPLVLPKKIPPPGGEASAIATATTVAYLVWEGERSVVVPAGYAGGGHRAVVHKLRSCCCRRLRRSIAVCVRTVHMPIGVIVSPEEGKPFRQAHVEFVLRHKAPSLLLGRWSHVLTYVGAHTSRRRTHCV